MTSSLDLELYFKELEIKDELEQINENLNDLHVLLFFSKNPKQILEKIDYQMSIRNSIIEKFELKYTNNIQFADYIPPQIQN